MTRIICQPSEKGGNSRQVLVKILFCSISEAVTKKLFMSHNFKNNDGLVLKIQIGEIRKRQLKKASPPSLLMVDHSS